MELHNRYDTTILLLAVSLTCFGIVMVYSASSIMAQRHYGDGFFFLKRQGVFAVLGFMAMAIGMHINLDLVRKLSVPLLLFCLLLLIAVVIPGVGKHIGGATRWLRIGGMNIQPAELTKIALVIYMAHSLAKKQDKVKTLAMGFIPYMVVLSFILLLLLLQPDLGSALTLGAVAMIMLLAAGTRLTYLFSAAILTLPFLYFMIMNVDYRRRRILAFLNPWDDPTGSGFQIIQSWIAFGSGGLVGKGLGEGKQKLFYLPEAHTDFIFSVVGEELGFIGVGVVMILFMVFVCRGVHTAVCVENDFLRFLAFGLTLLIGLAAFINIAVVMGMVPTKGMALPFISYGGTSLVTSLFAVGLLLNISRQLPGESR